MVNMKDWAYLGLSLTMAICLICEAQTDSGQNIQLSTKNARSLMRRFLAKFAFKSKSKTPTPGAVVGKTDAESLDGKDANIVAFRKFLKSDDFCSFEHVANFNDFVDKKLKRAMVTNQKLKQKYDAYVNLLFKACSELIPLKTGQIFSESFVYLEQPWYNSVYKIICEFIYHNEPSQTNGNCVIGRRPYNSFLNQLIYSEDDFFSGHVESYLKKKVETEDQKVDDVWLELKQAVEGVFYSNRNSITPMNMLFALKNEDEDLAEVYNDSLAISLIDLDFVATRLSMVDTIDDGTSFQVKMDMTNTLKFDDTSPYSWPKLQLDLANKYRAEFNNLF